MAKKNGKYVMLQKKTQKTGFRYIPFNATKDAFRCDRTGDQKFSWSPISEENVAGKNPKGLNLTKPGDPCTIPLVAVYVLPECEAVKIPRDQVRPKIGESLSW